jgi:predicted esterase
MIVKKLPGMKKMRISRAANVCGCLILSLLLLLATASRTEAVTPSGIQARFSKGQVFVTFNEVAGAGITYNVYRSASPITSIGGLTPVITLPQNSGLNLYTNQRFVVSDLGNPLAAGVGLFVYTSHAAGGFYYAVTSSQDSSIVPGANATTAAVTETVWEVPGAVQIGPPVTCGAVQCVPYMAWEDASTWDPAWGYYGRRFDVSIAVTRQGGQTYPLILDLHGAGASNYQEPNPWVDIGVSGIFVFPVDLAFLYGNVDPYTGTGALQTGWFGYDQGTGSNERAMSATEKRIVRYAQLIAADPQYQVDPTRLYVKGGSMGGGGALHVAMHYPGVFAAAAASLAWVGPTSWGNWTAFANNPPVDTASGPRWANWQDGAWMAANAQNNLPPIIHTFRSDDPIIPPTAYPDFIQKNETNKRAYIAHWQPGGHTIYWLDANASFARFRLNEAYPAFASASNSDSTAVLTTGQRNQNLDWSSSLHDLGAGTQIVDSANSFAMSFKSLSGDATADVTVLNAQAFYLRPSEAVSWTNSAQAGGATLQSGTAQADARGRLTIPALRITAAGNRLSLTCQTCAGPPPPRPPQNLHIVATTP